MRLMPDWLYFSSIGSLPVHTVAICGYLEPLGALVFSALLLGEKLNAIQIAGAVLILGGAGFGELMGQRQRSGGSAVAAAAQEGVA
jgi:drug/metabolite transporter (DMT)-like permease